MANFGINIGALIGALGAPIVYPFINGFRPSWASLEFRFGGALNYSVQSINYKIERTRKKTYGTNTEPLGKTRGFVDYTCKVKMLLAEFNQLIAQLGNQDQTGNNAFGDVFFNIDVSYSEANSNLIADKIIGCTIDSVEQDSAVGAEDIVVEFETAPLKITRNGQQMSSQTLGAPQF